MVVNFIKDSEFEEKVLRSQLPILVDFFAEWCGPCKLAEPVLEELADTYKEKAMIVKIDVDKDPEAAQKYGVLSIPTTILFKSGQEVGRQVRFAGKKAYEELLAKA